MATIGTKYKLKNGDREHPIVRVKPLTFCIRVALGLNPTFGAYMSFR